MYRCELNECNVIVPPRQPQYLIVTDRREKTYSKKVRNRRGESYYDTVCGWEIVKEAKVCPDCYEKITGLVASRANEESTPDYIRKRVERAKRPGKHKRNYRN